MKTISVTQPINLKVVKFELDFTTLAPKLPRREKKIKEIKIPKINYSRRPSEVPPPPQIKNCYQQKRDVKELVEELLDELYADQRDWSSTSGVEYSHCSTAASIASTQSIYKDHTDAIERSFLERLDVEDLQRQAVEWQVRLRVTGERLARGVRARDRLRRQQRRLCAALSVLLRHITGEQGARFAVAPTAEGLGEGGYAEWLHAMRLVARLPAGVPQHFRKKLWITLADRHLTARGIDWPTAESACFRGTAQPEDTELGAQIIKDLHRTGCSLFCGTEGRENQGMLRRVLLAYARWNKDVGYCQGFNMLAAIILEVMDKSESDSLKVMIYLVEAVLPEGYFADDLRGLSADMAAFRDLLRLRLPRLANHMDHLQKISDGGGVEPPLPDVFTMQWFLTLYATWLPRESLLRIWDLILLDGNEILLLTALAIWDMLQDRILSARSADDFYSCMGGGAGAVYQAGESLVARVVAFGSVPELPRLRSLHRYRVTPPAPPITAPVCQPPLHAAMQSMTKRGLRLFYSEDEGDSSDDGNKMALATVIPRREDRLGAGDRLSLDIGALKRQYARLRERQRQAHVILAAACARHAAVGVPTSPTSLTVNNLLLGKSAIVSSRGRRLGPPPGAVPPSRQAAASRDKPTTPSPMTETQSNETISWNEEKSRKNLSRRNSVKWKDIKKEKTRKASIDLDEAGDGIIVSEREADEMIASLRSRSSSESSSYSSHSASSTDTSLCDENERGSDSEPDMPDDSKSKGKNVKESKHALVQIKDKRLTNPHIKETKNVASSLTKDTKLLRSSSIKETKRSPSMLDRHASFDMSPLSKELKISPCSFTNTIQYSNSPTLKNPKITPSPIIEDSKYVYSPVVKKNSDVSIILLSKTIPTEVKNISDYLDSAAGEPLRTYIDGFETKLKDNLFRGTEMESNNPKSPFKSPYSDFGSEKEEVLMRLKSDDYSKSSESIRSSKPYKNLTDLSPINLSPCNFDVGYKSPYSYDFETNFKRPSTSKINVSTRPPDIIDTLTMYPNFVPDIDLSEKNVSDLDSPPGSPGTESIVVSEDEPPIPLRIDKYFEHSPEFFGARVTDANNSEIPNRRAPKRLSRVPIKPDSLTLQSSHNDKILKSEVERASSMPQSQSFAKEISLSPDDQEGNTREQNDKAYEEHKNYQNTQQDCLEKTPETKIFSPKDYVIRSGRKNSERALQIIQENSKILSRILTKQNISNANISKTYETKSSENLIDVMKPTGHKTNVYDKPVVTNFTDCSFLKESTSDSLIVHRNKNINNDTNEKNDFVRIRPISIDDPFSLDIRDGVSRNPEFTMKCIKSPSSECLGNKTDLYGWENKGFLAKSDFKNLLSKPEKYEFEYQSTKKTTESTAHSDLPSNDQKQTAISDWARNSTLGESKVSVTLPSSSELKDTSTYERRFTSDDYHYPLSTKYNDFILSKASDICSKSAGQVPKVCENLLKTDNSQVSEFAHVVTSSISFTYEPSADDDSPTGAKSNSSDTLCQITSLDQVSTPISPKIFPNRDTPILPKDCLEQSDKLKLESDDTCSAITSLIETDTLSSLSYPRSPSTGSYHPFPTRPVMRIPKELGVRLGMYPKDSVNSPTK